VIFVCLFSFSSEAQYGLSGGVSLLKGFGVPKPYVGFSLGGEFPRDNEPSFFIKASFYGKNRLDPSLGSTTIYLEALDPNNFSIASVSGNSFFNYTTINGGMRYYILDGYDTGFALYGGSNVMGVINQAKIKADGFDKSTFRIPATNSLNGTILNLGIGFSGGAKYTIPEVGTLFFDAEVDYLVFSLPSNQTASDLASFFYSPVVFSLTLGFRKDLY